MSWEHVIQAARDLGFPAVAFFALLYFGNKWAVMVVNELRMFRETMVTTTAGLREHMTHETDRAIREFWEQHS